MEETPTRTGFTGRRRLVGAWRVYVLLTALAVVVLAMMSHTYRSGHRMSVVHGPLVDAAMEVKLAITTGHLWLEEILSGDSTEDVRVVWGRHDEADWYANAMLEGGESQEGTFIPLDDDALRREIQAAQVKLFRLRQITEARIASASEAGIGTDIDQRFDAIYREVVEQTDRVETVLQARIAAAMATVRLARN